MKTRFANLPDNVKSFLSPIMSQDYASIHRDGWDEVSIEWKKEEDGGFLVKFPEAKVSFKFTVDGDFAGICNWKE